MEKTLILNDGEYRKFTEGYVYIKESLIPIMTSNTAPSGVASASSSYSVDYDAFRAFDRVDEKLPWATSSGDLTGWIEYKFESPKRINSYLMQQASAWDVTTMPKKWLFEGSNNGNNWDTLDAREDIFWTTGEKKEFSIKNNKEYLHYRVNVLHIDDPNYIVIQGIEMFNVIPNSLASWSRVSSTLPTSAQFISDGMNSLSPLLDRKVINLEPLSMTFKSEILQVGETGKVFSKTIDLKKIFDIRSMKVEEK